MSSIDLNIKNYDNSGLYAQGTYGNVSRLKHRKDGYEVACKIISSLDLERNGLKASDIQKEIEILEIVKNVKNPPNGLLKYYGQSSQIMDKTSTTLFYLFFEFLPLTLRQVLNENEKNGQCDFEFAFSVFDTLLNTLAFLQEIDINHRDIHPSNILFNHDKTQVKLIDFGLSKNIANVQQNRIQFSVSVLEGSLYIAPEFQQAEQNQRSRMKIDDYFKSDAYSFGLVMMELVRSKKLQNNMEDLDQKLKKAIEEVEKMRISDDLKEKHQLLVTLLKGFLKTDPKIRLNFRQAFLKKIQLNNPDKYNACILILESKGYPSPCLDTSLFFYF